MHNLIHGGIFVHMRPSAHIHQLRLLIVLVGIIFYVLALYNVGLRHYSSLPEWMMIVAATIVVALGILLRPFEQRSSRSIPALSVAGDAVLPTVIPAENPELSHVEEQALPLNATIPIHIAVEMDAIDAQKGRRSTITVHTQPGARARVEVIYLRSGHRATAESLKGSHVTDAEGKVVWTWNPEPEDRNVGTSKAVVTVIYGGERNMSELIFEMKPQEHHGHPHNPHTAISATPES
jgi:hypothetical protein